jgi:hypothetical protein
MRDLIFACMLGSGESEKDTLRLAHSLRTFGGQYCFNPIWMLTTRDEMDLSESTRQEIYSLGTHPLTFEMDASQKPFPFLSYVTAAGIAEGFAQGQTSFLALMAPDTLVLQEPSAFVLPVGKSFGGSPVHLKLLGSGVDEAVNDFWSLIYRHCQVEAEQIFPMNTVVDEQPVRAYFNAGILVVRPERGLLRSWQADFERIYCLPELEPFYRQSELYEIFMHQAVLAGSLLSSLKPDEFQQLPFEVNYPLHLHAKVPEARQPTHISQLITCRYEDYSATFTNPDVQALLQTDQDLKAWLQAQAA